jgi:hypothetical protein
MSSSSTLDPDRTPGKDRITGTGHGTAALGPSDSSDSGSDIGGGPGLVEGEVLGLGEGRSSRQPGSGSRAAGPDVGDANLDSDSDRYGTGERSAAGRDEPEDRDRMPDHIEGLAQSREGGDELDLASAADVSTDDLDADDDAKADDEESDDAPSVR